MDEIKQKIMNDRIEEIKNENVVFMEYSFEEVLTTFLEGYFCIYDCSERSSLINHICGQIDFKIFSTDYCDGVCEMEPYFGYIFSLDDIEVLVSSWSFDTKKFHKDFITPFKRDIQLNELLRNI
jgi:hypothetical protein